jgi:SM-20-related protein
MRAAPPPPPDTLRFLLELVRQDQSLTEADRSLVDDLLRAEGSLTRRLQDHMGEALVRPLFAQRADVRPRMPALPPPSPSGALQAEVVVIDGLLAPEEVTALLDFAVSQEEKFQASKIVLPGPHAGGRNDGQRRKSKVLVDLQAHHAVVVERIKAVLPWVFQRLHWPPFRVTQIEAQLTASNNGEFFKAHNDNAAEELRSRELTFVYYFYREPKAFTGGELRLYDTDIEGGHYVAGSSSQTISPEQNRVVFFPSCLVHEVLPIACPSGLFGDSRFTVNGWLHSTQRKVGTVGRPSEDLRLEVP